MKFFHVDNYKSLIAEITKRVKTGDQQAEEDLETLTDCIVRCTHTVATICVYSISDMAASAYGRSKDQKRDGRTFARAAECIHTINEIAERYGIGAVYPCQSDEVKAIGGFCFSLCVLIYGDRLSYIEKIDSRDS